MIEDEIVREVREAREAFAASHGYDIDAMVAALHELGNASGREIVRLAPKPVSDSELEQTEAEAIPVETVG